MWRERFWLIGCLWLVVVPASGQILVQDFEGLTRVSDFASNSPDIGQVNSLYASDDPENPVEWALIMQGGSQWLQFTESPTDRNERGQFTKAHEPADFVRLRFSLELLQDLPSGGYRNQAAGSFYLYFDERTDNFDSPVPPPRAQRIAEIEFLYQQANGLILQNVIRNEGGLVTTNPTPLITGSVEVAIIVNSSEEEQDYLGEDGLMQSIGSGKVDIWVANALVIHDVPTQAATDNPITRIKFATRNNAASGRIRFDNLAYTSLENAEGPLPVQWGDITATLHQQTCTVFWETIWEENNHYFVVERSTDGLSYDSLGTVEGAGTSYERREYSYSDPLSVHIPTLSNLYYRIRQVDYDGKTAISPVVSIPYRATAARSPYPNPFTSQITIPYQPEGVQQVLVQDLQGRLVYSAEVFQPLQEQHVDVFIPVELPAAEYLLLISAGREKLVYRIAKIE